MAHIGKKKSRRKKRLRRAGNGLPVLVDKRLLKALSHVVRQHILLIAVQRKVSPKELSKLLGEGLGDVSHHVRVLVKDCDEMLELVGTEPRRGATEHYYRATARTLIPAKTWRALDPGIRTALGGGMASDLFEDLSKSLEAGKLDRKDNYISRAPLVLDAEGQRKVAAIAKEAHEKVEREHWAARARMDKAGGKVPGVAHTFGVLSFEAPWEPPVSDPTKSE